MTSFYISRVPWHEPDTVPSPRIILAEPKERRATIEQVSTFLPSSRVVHISDLNDFCRCKRSWNWSSQLRRGLQPAVSPVPLFMGSAVHWALDHGYRGCIGAEHAQFDLDAALHALKTWIKHHIDRTIEYTGPLWEEEKTSIRGVQDLAVLMLRHYAIWAEPLDKLFRVLDMEYKFKVPLPGGHGMEYAGRFDGYVEDIQSGNRYILEFKTAKSIQNRGGGISSNISGVLRGMQSAAYTWASGQVHDEQAHGVLYRFLLKKEPDSPKPLQRGGYSRAKSIKSTDAWFGYILDLIAQAKLDNFCEEDGQFYLPPAARPSLQELREQERAKATETLQMLRTKNKYTGGLVTGNDFFLQLPMVKKPGQVQGALDAIIYEGLRMLDPSQRIYPIAGFHCNWCQFKTPCDLVARGMDDAAEGVLDANYGPRTYWEPEIADEY